MTLSRLVYFMVFAALCAGATAGLSSPALANRVGSLNSPNFTGAYPGDDSKHKGTIGLVCIDPLGYQVAWYEGAGSKDDAGQAFRDCVDRNVDSWMHAVSSTQSDENRKSRDALQDSNGQGVDQLVGGMRALREELDR